MGFFELLLIAVVALLVIGPERIPEAVRDISLIVGRIKRNFNNARAELEKEVGADKIRLQLHNEAVLESIEKTKRQVSGDTLTKESLLDSGEIPTINPHRAQGTMPNDKQ